MGNRQHFIPRFLLKRFTDDPTKRTICLYHFATASFRLNVSLRDQAYRSNFYGVDGKVEKIFEQIETQASSVIQQLVSEARPRDFSRQEVHDLYLFVLTQMVRTPANLTNTRAYIDDMTKEMFKKDDIRLAKYLNNPLFQGQNLLYAMLSIAFDTMDYLSDLRFFLCRNRTSMPLILGDHPAQVVNPFLSYHKWTGSKHGFGNIGATIILPVGSENMLVLYDPDCYRPVLTTGNSLTVADVTNMNLVQACYAENCLYFPDRSLTDHIRSLEERSRDFRKSKKSFIRSLGSSKPDKHGNYSEIMWSSSVDLPADTGLSCLAMTRDAITFKFGDTRDVSRSHTRYVSHVKGHDVRRKFTIEN
jgi:hypothetical protein